MVCRVVESLKESPGNGLPVEKIPEENSDFDRAVSLSLKTAEQEKAIREMQLNDKNQDPGVYSTRKQGRSSQQNGAEVVEQQLVSEESKRDGGSHLQQGKLAAHSDELGSLSPKELDESIMLETALFGKSPYTPNNLPIHASSSSSLSARQLLREQQDDEYLASHLADKEKEMNVVHEAATCQLKGDVNKRIEPMVVYNGSVLLIIFSILPYCFQSNNLFTIDFGVTLLKFGKLLKFVFYILVDKKAKILNITRIQGNSCILDSVVCP